MSRIKFPLVKQTGTNLIEYPDTPSLFTNVVIDGTTIYADYSGEMTLTEKIDIPHNVISKLDFRKRLTHDEKKLILSAKKVSLDIEVFLDDLAAAEEIVTDDPYLYEGLMAMELAEPPLLASGRTIEILTMEA